MKVVAPTFHPYLAVGGGEPDTCWPGCGQAPHEKVGLLQQILQVLQVLLPRYYLVEKTKDASRIGLLVGTLGTKDFTQMLDKLRQVSVSILKHPIIMIMT